MAMAMAGFSTSASTLWQDMCSKMRGQVFLICFSLSLSLSVSFSLPIRSVSETLCGQPTDSFAAEEPIQARNVWESQTFSVCLKAYRR